MTPSRRRAPRPQPQAGADQDGLRHGHRDVVYTDADLPFDMDELVKACRVMRHYEADLVSAYRLDRTGEGTRSFYSTIYNVLVRVLFGVRARVNFAFKLCRRSVLDHMTLVSEGRSSTPSWSSGPTSWASTSSSSVSTTSPDPRGVHPEPPAVIATSCRDGRSGGAASPAAGRDGLKGLFEALLRGGWSACWYDGPLAWLRRPAPGREPTDRSGAATCHLSTPPPCADGRRRSWPWRCSGIAGWGRSSGRATTRSGRRRRSPARSRRHPRDDGGRQYHQRRQAATGPSWSRGRRATTSRWSSSASTTSASIRRRRRRVRPDDHPGRMGLREARARHPGRPGDGSGHPGHVGPDAGPARDRSTAGQHGHPRRGVPAPAGAGGLP